MTVKSKIILLFLATAIFPLVAICLLIFIDFRSVLTGSIDGKLESLANLQKKRTIHLISEAQTLVTKQSQNSDVVATMSLISRKQDPKLLKRLTDIAVTLHKEDHTIRDVSFLNIQGIVIASTDKNKVKISYNGSETLRKGESKPDVSTFFLRKNGSLGNYLIAPIYSGKNKVGYILTETTGGEYEEIFRDYTGLGNSGDWGLVAKTPAGDARVIVPSRFEKRKEAAWNLVLPKKNNTLPAIQALSGVEGIRDLVDYRKEHVIAATRYIPETQWGIVVKTDASEAYAPIVNLQTQLLYFAGLMILFIFFLGSFITQFITEPITALTSAAKKIADGTFNTVAPISSNDEIGDMARAFNEMTLKLRNSYGALKEQEMKEAGILANIGEGLIVADSEGKIVLVNQALEEMLGVTDSILIGKPLTDTLGFMTEEKKNIPRAERPIVLALKSRKRVMRRGYLSMKGLMGVEVPVTVTATPLIVDGKLIGAISVIRDISTELAIDKAKDEFLSIAAHQLRTPLGTTRWNIERLIAGKLGKLTVRTKEAIQDMSSSNMRLIDLVNSLLNVSRINQGRITEKPEAVDLEAAINTAISNQNTLAKQYHVSVMLEKNSAKKVQVLVGKKTFLDVLENLISNAITYNHTKGTVKIKLTSNANEVTIAIKDSGIGIPKKNQKDIFTKFFRAPNVASRGVEGTGLGLFIVKSYVEFWNGTVRFESEENKGSTFFINLPVIAK